MQHLGMQQSGRHGTSAQCLRAAATYWLGVFLPVKQASNQDRGKLYIQIGPGGHADSPVAYKGSPHKGLHRIQALRLAAYESHEKVQRR